MKDPDYVVFGQPDIRDADIQEVVRVLESLWLGTGPRTHEFEQMFADYVGASHAVGLSSCTAALHLAMVALGVGPGDDVVVPTLTFPATANVVVHVGARPIFADVDPETRNLSPETLARALTDRTRAVIPVHLAGYPVDVDGIRTPLSGRSVAIVMDAAHGIETKYQGEPLGDAADATAYSFYVTKNITTGEGGMLTTPDEAMAERIRTLSLHGLSSDAWSRYSGANVKHYEVIEPGFKYNFTDLQAALGIAQLARVEQSWERRRAIWERYNREFKGLPLDIPPLPDAAFGRSALHLYSPLLDAEHVPFSRDELRARLHHLGVGTGIHFTSVHLHPYYRERFGFVGGEFPNAEHISERTFSLPLSPRMRDDQVDRVIDAVQSALASHA